MFFFSRRSDEQLPIPREEPEEFLRQPPRKMSPVTRKLPTTASLSCGLDVPIPTLTALPNTIVLDAVATALAPIAVAFVSPPLTLELAPRAVRSEERRV